MGTQSRLWAGHLPSHTHTKKGFNCKGDGRQVGGVAVRELWSWECFLLPPISFCQGSSGAQHSKLPGVVLVSSAHTELSGTHPLGLILLDWLHLLPSLECGAEQPQLQLSPSGKHIPAPSGAQTCSISRFSHKVCKV